MSLEGREHSSLPWKSDVNEPQMRGMFTLFLFRQALSEGFSCRESVCL